MSSVSFKCILIKFSRLLDIVQKYHLCNYFCVCSSHLELSQVKCKPLLSSIFPL